MDKKGHAHYFCSKKCEINSLKLGRKPRKVKWTEDYRKEKAIRMRLMKKEEKKVTKKEVPVEKKEEAKEEKKKVVKKEEKKPEKEKK